MVAETTKDSVQRLHRTTTTFYHQSAYALKDTQLKLYVFKQNVSSAEQYNFSFAQGNVQLRTEINNLKKNLSNLSMILVTLFTDDMKQEEKLRIDNMLEANTLSIVAEKTEDKHHADDFTSGSSIADRNKWCLFFTFSIFQKKF